MPSDTVQARIEQAIARSIELAKVSYGKSVLQLKALQQKFVTGVDKDFAKVSRKAHLLAGAVATLAEVLRATDTPSMQRTTPTQRQAFMNAGYAKFKAAGEKIKIRALEYEMLHRQNALAPSEVHFDDILEDCFDDTTEGLAEIMQGAHA